MTIAAGTVTNPRGSPLMRRLGIALLTLALILVVGGYALSRPFRDFGEYWAAGHLLLAHKTPYSLLNTYEMDRTLVPDIQIPNVLLCPPWVLGLVAPLGLLHSYVVGWLVWVAVLTSAVALSSRLLMDLYFADFRIPEISDTTFHRCIFAFTFFPVLLCLKFAQLSPVLLLGIAGFMYFDRERRPFLAGLFLTLTLVKPHLLFLVWAAVVIRSCQQRQCKAIAVAVSAIALLTTVGLALDHRAFQEYWELMKGPYPRLVMSGLLGIARGLFPNQDTYWLQSLPPIAGAVWFIAYWRRHRLTWVWTERMPTLVTVSVLTTFYGWIHDQTLLVVPITALAAHYSRIFGRIPVSLVALYTVLNVGVLLILFASTQAAFIPAPVLLAILLARTHTKNVLLWKPDGQA